MLSLASHRSCRRPATAGPRRSSSPSRGSWRPRPRPAPTSTTAAGAPLLTAQTPGIPDLAAARRALAELEAQVRRALNVPPLTPTVEAGPLERDLGRVRTLIDQALAKTPSVPVQANLETLRGQLTDVEGMVRRAVAPPSPIQIPIDLTGAKANLAQIGEAVKAVTRPTQPIRPEADVQPFQRQILAGYQAALANLKAAPKLPISADLTELERQVARAEALLRQRPAANALGFRQATTNVPGGFQTQTAGTKLQIPTPAPRARAEPSRGRPAPAPAPPPPGRPTAEKFRDLQPGGPGDDPGRAGRSRSPPPLGGRPGARLAGDERVGGHAHRSADSGPASSWRARGIAAGLTLLGGVIRKSSPSSAASRLGINVAAAFGDLPAILGAAPQDPGGRRGHPQLAGAGRASDRASAATGRSAP